MLLVTRVNIVEKQRKGQAGRITINHEVVDKRVLTAQDIDKDRCKICHKKIVARDEILRMQPCGCVLHKLCIGVRKEAKKCPSCGSILLQESISQRDLTLCPACNRELAEDNQLYKMPCCNAVCHADCLREQYTKTTFVQAKCCQCSQDLSHAQYCSLRGEPEEQCVCCSKPEDRPNPTIKLECKHVFHVTCIRSRLKVSQQKPQCPQCKLNISQRKMDELHSMSVVCGICHLSIPKPQFALDICFCIASLVHHCID